jgi:hypothetical protein
VLVGPSEILGDAPRILRRMDRSPLPESLPVVSRRHSRALSFETRVAR